MHSPPGLRSAGTGCWDMKSYAMISVKIAISFKDVQRVRPT